jgi:integrase
MSVYKRGDKGVFYMNFTVNGVRVFRSTGKYTKREAKQVEALEKQKVENEAKMTPQEKSAKMMLSEAIKKVYEERWKDNKDSKGALDRANNIVSIIGDIPLKMVNEDTARCFITSLEEKGLEPGTINRYLACLKTILKHLRQPYDIFKMKKERKGRIRVLSAEEELTVVNLLRNTNHSIRRQFYYNVADLLEVLVDTGCRLSEILNLHFDDVDFESNLISIWYNKGDRPRSIPMTERVKRLLKYRRHIDIEKPFSLTKYQADKAWEWVRKEMGLENESDFVIHSLRHTCATRLVNNDIDLYVVKEWLGHSSIQVTEKYAHLAPRKLSLALKALEEKSSKRTNGE